ncbi:YncE family protein [Mucilaginibacter ginsenosidivorax]|uniref:YncE family protein n=1 Tax=Mucilaginibacter ginsenosidivorax TaxID=862126 RepID=A0A5B8VXB5_9SPHI|nr:YncE family protein [Mucilaginibacter ginsenosidivorax]QEC76220.1 YncE family protein [Mucilaginibacter ginsenosidivorax]
MKSAKLIPALAFMAILIMAKPIYTQAQQKTGFHMLKSFPIKSPGGWDYITVDGANKRIYTSHGSQVNILSTSGDSIGYVPNTPGVHGIALVNTLNKGYISAGRANKVIVFDLTTLKVLNEIAVGTNPDAIFYEPFAKKVYTFNGRSKDATVIDVATDKVVATIPLDAKPETGVSDGKGKVFVNAETTNEVVVINATTLKVEARYKIEGGDEPSGLDIDRATNRLFIGCGGNSTMVVMDAANGKNLAKFPIGGCDGLVFDPKLKLAYASNGEGTISVVKELSADKFEFVENIPTEPSARTIGIDLLTHKLYLPAAKTEPGIVTAENPKPRPKQVPGSFHIIEVGKN